MANRKVTDLDPANPLDGSELLPIVQPVEDPADNKKLTVAQLSSYIESKTLAQKWKTPEATAATVAALPTNTQVGITLLASANGALPAQDGVTLVNGDSLLVKNEAVLSKNGLYEVTQIGDGGSPWVLTRRADSDTGEELESATVPVAQGATQADTTWRQIVDSIVIGVTDVIWQNILGSPLPDWSETTKGKVEAASQVESESAATAVDAANADVTKGASLRSLWWFWDKVKTISQTITGVWLAPKPNYNTNTAQIATMNALQESIRKSVDLGNINGTPDIDLSQGKHFKANRAGAITGLTVSGGISGETYYLTLTATSDFAFAWGTGLFGSGNGNLPMVTNPSAGPYSSVEDIYTIYISQVTGKAIIVGTQNIRYN